MHRLPLRWPYNLRSRLKLILNNRQVLKTNSTVVDSESPSPPEVLSETKDLSTADDPTPDEVVVESHVSPDITTDPKLDTQDEAIEPSTHTESTLESSKELPESALDLKNSSTSEVPAETKDLSPTDDSTPPTVVVESEDSPDLGADEALNHLGQPSYRNTRDRRNRS
ncbi:uncharacterized protein MELLADRAFT_93979 [Melampsora larici-populina 98AG31]|uniref:Uncharacterized protein n=1 Tax=Melampsora larici-populina (strain 98AG31 / pathotype 3-4-7) TaxID=747676 RepID=F4S5Z4_MELLP|nr:uncharacterized protein MELLADRAFT_93979 [Melampsora larici-populina 98AG31]EGF99933.1 hypothetical protein MELLADRAFT_93979 [Melampsora larici-populina 98AG31]